MSNMRTRVLATFVLTMVAAACHGPATCQGGETAAAEKPLAHWTFDEPSGTPCHDASGNGRDAGVGQPDHPGMTRVGGLFGNAMNFSGGHDLRVSEKLNFTTLPRISLSAWVMPDNLGGYREIFRKENGNNRILFSFQANGTILSLGLNVGGYHECDAKIDPAVVLDGMWHHCAATFDGQAMRVYLDGCEVGRSDRVGKITAGGPVAASIGSNLGGECFQGKIDELSIHADALAPQRIAVLYRDGVKAMEGAARELKKRLAAVYVREPSFAETVVGARRRVLEAGFEADRKLTGTLPTLLRADFPDGWEQFRRQTRLSLTEYFASKDLDAHVRLVERLMALALEYKPLTEGQWARHTPEQRRQWEEVDRIQREFDALKAQGEAARFSPRWIELMTAAGAKIHFRPSEREPVAPYRTPSTPETRATSRRTKPATRWSVIGCIRPTRSRRPSGSRAKSAGPVNWPNESPTIMPSSTLPTNCANWRSWSAGPTPCRTPTPRCTSKSVDSNGRSCSATRSSTSRGSCWSTCPIRPAESRVMKPDTDWATMPSLARDCWCSMVSPPRASSPN